MPVVAQVSDLHLCPRVPERQAQAELVLAGINASRPDLTVITGDLTDDGWDRPEDLVWAKQWMDERLDGAWFAVPGNHDVGNFAGAEEGAITAERVEAWNNIFGFTSWKLYKTSGNVEWAVLGLNSMLLGSSLPSEEKQSDVIAELDFEWRDRVQVALFFHSPLFLTHPQESSTSSANYWLGPTMARERMSRRFDRIGQFGAAMLASGHVHQMKMTRIGEDPNSGSTEAASWQPLLGTHIVWAPPASGTWVHAPGLPNPPAPERTGFVLHHLGDDGSVRSEVVECAPMLKTVFFDPSESS